MTRDGGGPVIGVVGGSGGVGASSFAIALAAACGPAVLIDLDVDGGGLDVLLGLEHAPGARWSGLQLAGGALDAGLLRAGVCEWSSCALLACDVVSLDPEAVRQVLGAAATTGSVVLDLPRRECAERAVALARCHLVVVVARADVAGLVAAHGVVAGLGAGPSECAIGVVVRAGEVPASKAARLVGGEFLGQLPTRRRYRPAHPGRAVVRLAAGIVGGTARQRVAA